jgi:hypothetical protein
MVRLQRTTTDEHSPAKREIRNLTIWSAAGSEAPRRFGEQRQARKAVSPLRSATALQISVIRARSCKIVVQIPEAKERRLPRLKGDKPRKTLNTRKAKREEVSFPRIPRIPRSNPPGLGCGFAALCACAAPGVRAPAELCFRVAFICVYLCPSVVKMSAFPCKSVLRLPSSALSICVHLWLKCQLSAFQLFPFLAPRSPLRPPSSVLRPPSSVLCPPSSVLRPPSSVLCPPPPLPTP